MRTQFLAAAAVACLVAVSASNAFADERPDVASPLGVLPEVLALPTLRSEPNRLGLAPRERLQDTPTSVTSITREQLERSGCGDTICGLADVTYQNYNPSSGSNADNWGATGVARINLRGFLVDGSLGYNRTNATAFDVDTTQIEVAPVLLRDDWQVGANLGYQWNHTDFGGFTANRNTFNFGAYAVASPTDTTLVGGTVGGFSGTGSTGGWYVGGAIEQRIMDRIAGKLAIDHVGYNNHGGSETSYSAHAKVNFASLDARLGYTRTEFSNNFHVDTWTLGVTLYVATIAALQNEILFGHAIRRFQPLSYKF